MTKSTKRAIKKDGGNIFLYRLQGPDCPKTFLLFMRLHIFKQHFVRHKRNEFAVGGLFGAGIYLYAENGVDVFYFALVPGDLYGVTDCAFHLGGTGLKAFGNLGIQSFGDTVDDVGTVDRHFNGFP